MTIEHVKAFGTWLSNMLYWVLEPVLGSEFGARGTVQHELDGPESDLPWYLDQQPKAVSAGVYSSAGEAAANGGGGVSIGGGLYI